MTDLNWTLLVLAIIGLIGARVDLLPSALPKALMPQSPHEAYLFRQEVSHGKKRLRLPVIRL